MYKNILVPLDGSPRAEGILPHVEDLALKYQARVIFLHVVESSFAFMGAYEAPPQLNMAEIERRADEGMAYLSELERKYAEKGFQVGKLLEQGAVVETILSVAQREGADLIAMASHGRGGLARVFYGSVAAGILQRVDRPLLLIRSRESD